MQVNEIVNKRIALGKNAGFTKFNQALAEINNPQDSLKVIHFAGTNGKGSTLTFCKLFLQRADLKIGTFTSPSMIKHNDRIMINDQWISDADFISIYQEYQEIIERYEMSMFEMDTLIMFVYFKREKVDYALVEVGLGGRLDSTNVIQTSLAAVITNINLDHTQLLGNTIQQIAKEKAGIIKPHNKVFLGDLKPAAQTEILKIAKLKQATVYFSKPEVLNSLKLPQYQLTNLNLAIRVIQEIRAEKVTKKEIDQIIEQFFWIGRYQKVSDHPLTIVDGAHNLAGLKALLTSLKKERKPIILVMAMMHDKQYLAMINYALVNVSQIILTTIDLARCQKDYANLAENIIIEPDYELALKKAQSMVKDQELICLTGSLYFISEILKEKEQLFK